LWSTVAFLHPAVHRTLDWDDAFAGFLGRLEDPEGDPFLKLTALLDSLGDPSTRLEPAVARRRAPGIARRPRVYRPDAGVAVVVAADFDAWHLDPDLPARLAALFAEAKEAAVLVLDFRDASWWFGRHVPEAVGSLVPADIVLPAERFRFHSGWASERADASGGLFSGSMVKDAEVIFGTAVPGPGPRLVIVVNEHSGLSLRVAAGLLASGRAEVVVDGPPFEPGSSVTIPLKPGLRARVRTSEWLGVDGTIGVPPLPAIDVAPGAPPAALARAALAAVDHHEHRPAGPRPGAPPVVPAPLRPPLAARRPWDGSRAQRLLGLFRLRGVLEEFFAYPELLGAGWDSALPDLFDAFASAGDELDFCRAIARMLVLLPDSHARVRTAVVRRHLGVARPPVKVGTVDGLTVVLQSGLPDLRVGDIVIEVDGRSVDGRRADLKPWLPSSTPQALVHATDGLLLAGPASSPVPVRVDPAVGGVRTVVIGRRAQSRLSNPRRPVELLAGAVGYVDLTRLAEAELLRHWNCLASARSFVFDLRGYTQGAVWSLVERLNGSPGIGVRFRRRELRGFGPATRSRIEMAEGLRSERRGRPRPSVALVDAATISQAEYTALLLQAGQGTWLVGTPTNGTVGDVVTTTVSAGVTVTFTGQATMTAAGWPVQGVGLQPDHRAAPTVEGLRAGRDEVLEAGLQVLAARR